MRETTKSFLEANMAIVLFAFPGLFVKVIALPPYLLVFGRAGFAAIALFFFLKFTKQQIILHAKRDFGGILLLGVLLTIHWVTYFAAIQFSTVAIGMIAFFTSPIMTALLEPCFSRQKIQIANIVSAVLVLIGIFLIVPKFSLTNNVTFGIVLGVISAFTYSLRLILNRRYIRSYSGSALMLYQTLCSAILLAPFLFLDTFSVATHDIWQIALLGILFTALAHTLFIRSLKHLSAYTAGVLETLSLLYGVVLAWLWLGEVPAGKTLLGGAIILSAVLFETLRYRVKT